LVGVRAESDLKGFYMANKVLKPTTAQRLLRKLAEPEGRNVSRYGYTPRDLQSGTGAQKYHFQLVQDTTYDAQTEGDPLTNRRIGIRYGLFQRISGDSAGVDIPELAITSASGTFDPAAGTTVDDIAICQDPITDGETWTVYLFLYNANTSLDSGITPTNLCANYRSAALGTRNPPSDPAGANAYKWFRILGTVSNDGGTLTFDQEWRGGNIKDFMLQPDGQFVYEGSINNQRVFSLDYVSDAAGGADDYTRRHLQDYQAYEDLVDSTKVTEFTNDYAISFFDYSSTAETVKKYARIDSTNASESGRVSAGKGARSLEIIDTFQAPDDPGEYIAQLYDFLDPSAISFTDAVTQSGDADLKYLILARYRNDGEADTLRYLDISAMNVASADVADEVDRDWADEIYWYNMGTGRYDETNDNFETVGHCAADTLALIDTDGGATTGIDADNQWSVDGFKYLMDNGAKLTADIDHIFSATNTATQGRVRIDNTEKASRPSESQAGSLQVAGGMRGFYNLVVANGTDDDYAAEFYRAFSGTNLSAKFCNSSEAGIFADTTATHTAKLCDGTNVGFFENATSDHTAKLCDGTNVAYFYDGTESRTVKLCDSDNNQVGFFEDASNQHTAKLCDGSNVGYFADDSNSHSVEICDGTYAVDALGANIKVATGVFQHEANEGVSTDSGFSGGILYDGDALDGRIEDLIYSETGVL